ncbi:MAG: hypothetical protein CMO01_01300 [Thalassobius sp.]|nr:hypothetical protein [Thalassovita sp.]
MKSYTYLSKIPLLKKSFTLKILSVTFLGIHIPLFGIIGYLLINEFPVKMALLIGTLTLIFTLISTATTLIILNKLLKPIILVKNSLSNYIRFSKIPDLPKNYADEVGTLLHDVQMVINVVEKYKEEQENILNLLNHDLISPINSTIGSIDLIKNNSMDNRLLEALESKLNQYSASLTRSMNYIKLQKNTLGDESITLLPTNILKLVEDAIESFQFDATQKNVIFEKLITTEVLNLPQVVIEKTLNNLINNAVKFTEYNSTITIKTDVENNMFKLSVIDQGEGIPEDKLPIIFEYNRALVNVKSHLENSNGIGLHICKKLMNNIGGDIVVKNNSKSRGAIFTIEYSLG